MQGFGVLLLLFWFGLFVCGFLRGRNISELNLNLFVFFSPWCHSAWVIIPGFMPKWVQWFWQDTMNFITLFFVRWKRNKHVGLGVLVGFCLVGCLVLVCFFPSQAGFQVWDFLPDHSALRWRSRSSLLGTVRSKGLVEIIAADFRSPSGRQLPCLLYVFISLKWRRLSQLPLGC